MATHTVTPRSAVASTGAHRKHGARVLHLLSSTGFHGAEHQAAELVRQLGRFGVASFIGAFRNNANSNLEVLQATADCAAGTRIFDCNGRIDARVIFALRDFVRTNGIDIIHSHKYKTNLYSLLASPRLPCKLVATCHNWLTGSVALRIYAELDKTVLRYFDAAVGVSEGVARQLRARLPRHVVHKVVNGVDVERYRPAISRREAKNALGLPDGFTVGFVGRLSAAKGVDVLLQALRKLRDRNIDIWGAIVGDGEHRAQLSDTARALGLEERVRFFGDRADTPLVYAAFDVFVLPSFNEAFPMVVLEAMASGVPVVATRVGDVGYIIEDQVSGLLVEPGNVDTLCDAIASLFGDGDRMATFARQARERVMKEFSSRTMAQRYCSIYQRILDRDGQAAVDYRQDA